MPRLREAMSSNKAFGVIVTLLSIAWYLLCAFAQVSILNSHILAYLLFVYVSGFCVVGLGKFFYVSAYKNQKSFSKKEFYVFSCVSPMTLLGVMTVVFLIAGIDAKVLASAAFISFGALCYCLIFSFIEKRFFKK